MKLIAFFILLWTAMAGKRETHSLYYIYTALSRDLGLPGIHKFTAMGMLDNVMIDYFDSETQKKVPKQTWIKDQLDSEYWVKGTQSRLKKQQWFEVNINILKDRMRQNDTDLHVLQWMVGCEGEMEPNGWMKFYRGMSRYGYDGKDFLFFEKNHLVWVASMKAAEETKRKWDDDRVMIDKIDHYLENDCMLWLNKFWGDRMNHLKTAAPPEVYVFERDTNIESNIRLTCLATGFYPQDIIMSIKRDGHKLYREDGLESSGVRPNEDDTFQRRDSVKILRKDKSRYTCEVIHEASSVNVTKEWENPGSGSGGPIIGVAVEGPLVPVLVSVLVLVLVAVVLVVLYKKGIIGGGRNGSSGSQDSSSIGSSTDLADVQIPLNDNINGPATRTADNISYRGSQGSGSSGDSGVIANGQDGRTPSPEAVNLLPQEV